jgi:hypothetical protein
MTLCRVTAWLMQDLDADNVDLDNIVVERKVAQKSGFSYAQVGEFKANHPLVRLPALADRPKAQVRQNEWEDVPMAHRHAGRDLWALVGPGVYLTAATSMQHLEEAGVQTLVASVLVGCPSLLGHDDVKLMREAQLRGSERNGPIEFTFWSRDEVIDLVVEVKTHVRMETEYAKSVEQLYAEMYAAWEHNLHVGEGGRVVSGMLVDGVGAVMFRLSAAVAAAEKEAAVKGLIACSEYMPLFETYRRELTPGPALELWLHRTLAAVLPGCVHWDGDAWAARASVITAARTDWAERCVKIFEAMTLCDGLTMQEAYSKLQ